VYGSTLGGAATILNAVIRGFQSPQTSIRMMPQIRPRLPPVGRPAIIISDVTPSSHNSDPEYCILSQTRTESSTKEPTRHTGIPYVWGAPLTHGTSPHRRGLCLSLISVTGYQQHYYRSVCKPAINFAKCCRLLFVRINCSKAGLANITHRRVA